MLHEGVWLRVRLMFEGRALADASAVVSWTTEPLGAVVVGVSRTRADIELVRSI